MTKAELKVARLVCKSLDQVAVPFLFDEVFVAAIYSDLDTADLVASRFGAYVKTITLSFVEYKPLSLEQYRWRRESQAKANAPQRFNGHLEHAFEVYCKAQKENYEINESGEFLARICRILSWSPKVQKMVLTDYGNDDVYEMSHVRRHDPWKQDDLCPFKECMLSVSDHFKFHLRPRPPYQMTPNPFHLAILAITLAKSTITELAMIHDGEDEEDIKDAFLNEDAFVMTVRQSGRLTLQLQHLTKLRIRVRDLGGEPIQAQPSHHSGVVARALQYAINLKSLFFEGEERVFSSDSDTLTSMSESLGGCQFPKLTSLILKHMDSREDELLDFLKSSPGLKHLALQHINLKGGSWEYVAERIRSAFQLKSVMFYDITRCFPNPSNDDYDFTNDHRLIRDFFFHNGENPFTEAAMTLWHSNDLGTKYGINRDQRGEKNYQMFH